MCVTQASASNRSLQEAIEQRIVTNKMMMQSYDGTQQLPQQCQQPPLPQQALYTPVYTPLENSTVTQFLQTAQVTQPNGMANHHTPTVTVAPNHHATTVVAPNHHPTTLAANHHTTTLAPAAHHTTTMAPAAHHNTTMAQTLHTTSMAPNHHTVAPVVYKPQQAHQQPMQHHQQTQPHPMQRSMFSAATAVPTTTTATSMKVTSKQSRKKAAAAVDQESPIGKKKKNMGTRVPWTVEEVSLLDDLLQKVYPNSYPSTREMKEYMQQYPILQRRSCPQIRARLQYMKKSRNKQV